MTDLVKFNYFLKEQLKDDEKIVLEYSGAFDQKFIRESAFKLNELTKEFVVTQRRIFYVYVELAQNVGFYSDEKNELNENGGKLVGCGNLVVYETENSIGFIIGNVINNQSFNVLWRKCKIINSLDRDSLREFKRFQRNLIPGTNSNAHIGLIMVALTTRKPIDLKHQKIDDKKSFFLINVNVEKEKN